MLAHYRTVQAYGSSEIIIKKSRFIGHAKPVESEEEAIQFIEAIKKEHKSATHNCSAYVIGERDQIQKQSDDGEPSGTAGKPILEVIKHQGLKNTVVVVTRYFGGIMLGAGGLIRAYTDGAVTGIEAGKPIYKVNHQLVLIEVDYTWYGKLENELRNQRMKLGEILFTDKVTVPCYPLAAEAEAFMNWATDVTQGQSVITVGESGYIDHESLPE
ncbi:YigZ family protein [Paenibacillus roseipurpureus]|uniref:YigZ family protein n=1 Tax=Paenibacillus roseopurpureus TaxID=2918901 RepID=A0AA96LQ37_9BACL|nr:YigZ family protein [Paenibacillus sp. MBLB1832]WNR43753.1 YigZ family protein [Paenibacillus sp. MBLB1832]